jgi:cardiolipin synthase A/B
MRRRRARRLAFACAALALVAWRLLGDGPSAPVATLPAAEPAGATADSLILEPDAGMAPIYSLLASPRRTLDMTMYELVDPAAESLLATDAARGVRVRVLLDHRLERQRNAAAYDFLRSRGVEVVWSSGRYFATHEKAFVVDGMTAVVMSLNLTDRYYATTRDLAVVDHDRADIAAIETVFDSDLRGDATRTPAGDDLVWSPDQSQADLLALIDGARRSIAVESEELSSQVAIDALIRAARRGVAVSVVMTFDPGWVPALNALAMAGAHVAVLHGESPLYIHAKLLAIDVGTVRGRGFVGSENLADSSLLHDRELGIVLVAPRLVSEVSAVVARDASDGQSWR